MIISECNNEIGWTIISSLILILILFFLLPTILLKYVANRAIIPPEWMKPLLSWYVTRLSKLVYTVHFGNETKIPISGPGYATIEPSLASKFPHTHEGNNDYKQEVNSALKIYFEYLNFCNIEKYLNGLSNADLNTVMQSLELNFTPLKKEDHNRRKNIISMALAELIMRGSHYILRETGKFPY